MQRFAVGLALAAITLIAAACGGGGATTAPATPGASASPGASAPAGSGLAVVAKDVAFNPTSLTTKADAEFTIDFDNQESAPHNIAIKDASGAVKFKGEIITSSKVTYTVPALAAGSYAFWCEVHPNMTGTLTVQ
jgi:plastocyanin